MKEAVMVAGGFVAGAIFGASVYHGARVQADRVIATAHQVVDAGHSHVRAAQSALGAFLERAAHDAAAAKK